MLCPECGADMEAWQETFGEEHSCPGKSSTPQNILRVLSVLRKNGIPCFLIKDLTTPELEKQIKGEG